MIENMLRTIYCILIIVALLVAWWWFEVQYEAIRKYYPGLTRWEYFILQNKIRIIPEEI